MNAFRVAVLIASLIVVNGEAQESEDREVTSLNSLQNSQAPAYNALPAQSYGSPYGYQQPQYGGYGYQQPQMYQPQPPMPWYPQSQPQYPNYGGNMNYGYGAQPVGGAMYQPPVSTGGSVSGKPDYEMSGDFTTGSVPSNTPGVIVEDGSSNPGLNWQGSTGGLNWQGSVGGNTGGLNWQGNAGFNFGPPNWQQSFTPISNGCYNRCKPSCSFRPPPRPLPMPIRPRPRPPMPRPLPMPAPRPQMGCRSVCRPMCNQTPTCGGGSQFNGNTMVCGQSKPNYGGFGGYGGNYGYGYNYGNQMQTYAQPQVQAAAQVTKEDPQADSEEEA